MRRNRSGWVVLLALGVCASSMAAPQKRKSNAGGSPRAAKGVGAPKAPSDLLLQATDEITREVASLRGLPVKRPLQRGVLKREEIGKKLRDRISKEYTPEEVKAEALVLRRLGLLPSGIDYEQLILDILMEQVAGFYDPFSAKLYIADWLPLDMQRPALAHEIGHALQDQHYDLKRFATPIKDNGDLQLAHSALVEGDGTAVMIEFQARAMGLPAEKLPELVAALGSKMLEGGMAAAPLFDKAPRFLKESLLFPYLEGLRFVEYFRAKSPWAKLEELWKRPPESTEQVMHPEKYVAREAPISIAPGPVPSLSAKKELRRDVLGEFGWKTWLVEILGEEGAAKAAQGWGGDRVVAYQGSGSGGADALPTVAILAAWDTEADAIEVDAKLKALVTKLCGTPATGEVCWRERRAAQTLVVLGAPSTVDRAVMTDEIWKGWKIGATTQP